ncbi:MAG: MATE family efflux transporter, partial [Steroidobacteraceae bacterium]|nr:MATE family efflux transporter [Steroidobacteraceae bacterium]
VAAFQVADGLQVGAAGALRGFKDARVPMLLNVVAYWLIGFPLAYGFGVVLGQGVRAVWTGLIAGLVVCAVLLSWRYALITRRAVAARAV